jgi:hypothetical protein
MTSYEKHPNRLTARLIGENTISLETSRSKPTLPYVVRWTLRSLSLGGAFAGAEIVEAKPGIVVVKVEDADVIDLDFLDALLIAMASRWALVHGLDTDDIDLNVRAA